MKTVGDVLSALFDEEFVKKAQGYSKLFDSWTEITAKNGIADASAYSRIKDLNNGILLIEMDHPGWKQILQTKRSSLLNDFRANFPEMNITGISLILGKPNSTNPSSVPANHQTFDSQVDVPPQEIPAQFKNITMDYESIKDEDLKQKLIQLGQTLAAREK